MSKIKKLKTLGMLFLLVISIFIFSSYVNALTANDVCSSGKGYYVGISKGQEPGAEPIEMKEFEIWACDVSESEKGYVIDVGSEACKVGWQFADFEQTQEWVTKSISGCYVYSGSGNCNSKCEIGNKGDISVSPDCEWNETWNGVLCFKLQLPTQPLPETLPETCDGKDNDNDGEVDEDFDEDKDTYTGKKDNENKAWCGTRTNRLDTTLPQTGWCSWANQKEISYDLSCDCDDNNSKIYPGAKEVCNGVDDNCNGLIDNADLSMEPCHVGWMCENSKCVEDVCDGIGADNDRTDKSYCDKDGDKYCALGKKCAGTYYNCVNGECRDCKDNPDEDLTICEKIVCCQDTKTNQFSWGIRTGETCNNNNNMRALGGGDPEFQCRQKLTKTKALFACGSEIYSGCSFCINPGMKKRCGVDADCSEKVWNGYTEGGIPIPCQENEQCVMYGKKEFDVKKDVSLEGTYTELKECKFYPGGVEGDAQCYLKEFKSWAELTSGSVNERINCLPDNENIIIDKRTGELDWFKFARENDEKGGTNPCSILALNPESDFWKTACVKRDKCMDEADNDGEEDISEAYPMKKLLMTFDYLGKQISIGNGKFELKLTDADDPDCRLQEYCKDADRDGFCDGTENAKKLGFQIPQLFPDCDDDLSDDNEQYAYKSPLNRVGEQVDTFPIVTGIDQYGVPIIEKKLLTATDVHPFQIISPGACYYGFDINCNVNNEKGYDYESLKLGEKIFDVDLATGKENFDCRHEKKNIDYACYVPYTSEWNEMLKTTGYFAGSLGGTVLLVFALPQLAIPLLIVGTAGSGFTLGRGIVEGSIDKVVEGSFGLVTIIGFTYVPYAIKGKPAFPTFRKVGGKIKNVAMKFAPEKPCAKVNACAEIKKCSIKRELAPQSVCDTTGGPMTGEWGKAGEAPVKISMLVEKDGANVFVESYTGKGSILNKIYPGHKDASIFKFAQENAIKMDKGEITPIKFGEMMLAILRKQSPEKIPSFNNWFNVWIKTAKPLSNPVTLGSLYRIIGTREIIFISDKDQFVIEANGRIINFAMEFGEPHGLSSQAKQAVIAEAVNIAAERNIPNEVANSKLLAKYSAGKLVSLGEVSRKNALVCRHRASLLAEMLQYLKEQGYIGGEASLEWRPDHVIVKYITSDASVVYYFDPMNRQAVVPMSSNLYNFLKKEKWKIFPDFEGVYAARLQKNVYGPCEETEPIHMDN